MIVFFINRFNDVDHIVPVVYRIAKDTNKKLLILSLNPNLDIYSDFRLKFLRENFNIKIDYVYNFCCFTITQKIIGYLLSNPTRLQSSKKYILNALTELFRGNSKILDKIILLKEIIFCGLFLFFNRYAYDWIAKNLLRKHFGKKWAYKMCNTIKPFAMIFDYAAHLNLFNVAALLSVSKELNIPSIDLPSGISLYKRFPSPDYDKSFSDILKNDKDYMAVANQWFRDDCVEHGLEPKKMSILGSGRFCREWTGILYNILPPSSSLKNKGTGKLKVVYMEMGAGRHHGYLNTVKESIEKLSKLEFIHLIFKPQTRNNKVHFELPPTVEVADSENSVNLIKWADVVIVIMSSIILEVLLQDKVFIYPKFFHGNEMMTFDEYNACWTVNSYEEMREALTMLSKNPTYKPYSQANVKRYLTEVIYNGEWERDVLGDYKRFILSISQK